MKHTEDNSSCWWWLASLFMAAVIGAILAGCTAEELPAALQERREEGLTVTLTFQMPGSKEPISRSLSVLDEQAVKTIHILVFQIDGATEKFAYEAYAVLNSNTSCTVRLHKSRNNESYRLVILANTGERIPYIPEGTTKKEALKLITFSSTSPWRTTGSTDFTPIPMWGETATSVVVDERTLFSSVSLLRALARVDVGLVLDGNGEAASGLANFKLTSVSMYNSRSRGYVAPIDATLTNGVVSTVSIPPTAVTNSKLTYTAGDYKSLIRTIYLTEVAAGTKSTTPYLVIGGVYNAKTCYYRVDFKASDGSYTPLKRNCRYVVDIISVETEGYETEEEAKVGDKGVETKNGVTVTDWINEVGNNTDVTI